MSNTPRTDEAQFGTGRVSVSFARQLERELNAAQQRIKRLEEAGDAIFLLAEKHAPEYWLYTQTAFNNWRKAKEAKL
jgi:hypothetical protein